MYEDLWPVVTMFFQCGRYWRRTIPPMGGRMIWEGLDPTFVWTLIHGVHGMRGKKARKRFEDIAVMETAALEVLNAIE